MNKNIKIESHETFGQKREYGLIQNRRKWKLLIKTMKQRNVTKT